MSCWVEQEMENRFMKGELDAQNKSTIQAKKDLGYLWKYEVILCTKLEVILRMYSCYGTTRSLWFSHSICKQGHGRCLRTTQQSDQRQIKFGWWKRQFTEWEMTCDVKDVHLILVVVSFSVDRLYIGKLWPVDSQASVMWANRNQMGRTVVSLASKKKKKWRHFLLLSSSQPDFWVTVFLLLLGTHLQRQTNKQKKA